MQDFLGTYPDGSGRGHGRFGVRVKVRCDCGAGCTSLCILSVQVHDLDEAPMRLWLRRRCRRRFDEAGDHRRPGMKQSLRSTWTRRGT